MSDHPIRLCRPICVVLTASLFALVTAGRVAAGVTTVGAVTPTPTAGQVSTQQLIVGSGTNDTGTDIWGWVSLDGGSSLQYGSLIVGDNDGFFGQMNVSGNFLGGQLTKFNLSFQGNGNSNPTVQVGNEGTGYLNLSGGSTMTLTNSNADMAIGLEYTGVGYVTATDQFTILTVPENFLIGSNGFGSLNVLNRAIVRTQNTSRSNFVSIGRNPMGVGNVLVDGLGSTLNVTNSLRVGDAGVGTLTVSNGALVNVIDGGTPIIGTPPPFMSIGSTATGIGNVLVEGTGSRILVRRDLQIGVFGHGTLKIRNNGIVQIVENPLMDPTVIIGPNGRVELSGGSLLGSTPDPAPVPAVFGTTLDGYLGGSGLVRGTVHVGENAFVEANAGDLLRFDSAVSNQGSVTVRGGEIQFAQNFANNAAGLTPSGRVSLEDGGTVRFSSPLTNNGILSSAHGATNIHGQINNPGDIVVARDTVASFYDPVNNTGTITVLPGGNALFLADLTFTSAGAGAGDFGGALGGSASGGPAGGAATLILGVDAENPGDASSHVNVSGVATLAGTLVLSLDGGYSSLIGQTLNLITAGNVVGAFDSIQLPPVPNDLEIGLVYTSTGLSMQISSISNGIPGDYNDDGIVNAADYTVWRDHLGNTTSLVNDDTPGVGEDDYIRWKSHFGETRPFGAGSSAFDHPLVPEPSAWLLTLAGAISLLNFPAFRRRLLNNPL